MVETQLHVSPSKLLAQLPTDAEHSLHVQGFGTGKLVHDGRSSSCAAMRFERRIVAQTHIVKLGDLQTAGTRESNACLTTRKRKQSERKV